jgi:hypothetical protein
MDAGSTCSTWNKQERDPRLPRQAVFHVEHRGAGATAQPVPRRRLADRAAQLQGSPSLARPRDAGLQTTAEASLRHSSHLDHPRSRASSIVARRHTRAVPRETSSRSTATGRRGDSHAILLYACGSAASTPTRGKAVLRFRVAPTLATPRTGPRGPAPSDHGRRSRTVPGMRRPDPGPTGRSEADAR